MEYILFIVLSFGIGVSKAVSDIVSHVDLWNKSIFKKYSETSFYGPKDKTWIRKDNDNKFINFLLHYPFVFLTDIWHFSNAINNLCIIFVILFGSIYGNIYAAGIVLIVRLIVFNLFYHKLLLNEK